MSEEIEELEERLEELKAKEEREEDEKVMGIKIPKNMFEFDEKEYRRKLKV